MTEKNFEHKENIEKITSKIDLRFFRHGEKEPSVSGKPDEEIQLTEKGRGQAIKKSEDEDISQSLAFGSSRKRAQQTAGLVMAGKLDEITGNESLDELKQKLNKGLKEGGSKISIDNRLNYNVDLSTEFGKKYLEAFKNGVFLKFVIEQSDSLAKSFNEIETDNYSRMAGQIAEVVKKYIGIATHWDALVKDEGKQYKDTLKRFLGTHQGVAECFLLKVVEKTKGENERNELITALNNVGFDFTEGFDVDIENTSDGKREVRIIFKKEKDGKTIFKYDEIVPEEVIDSIIKEKNN